MICTILLLLFQLKNNQFGSTFKPLSYHHRKELYHIGASLKDLGKRWFAFSKLDGTMLEFVQGRLIDIQA